MAQRGHAYGHFHGRTPTQKTVSVTGASFCRFADDLLAEDQVVWDPWELLTATKILSVGADE